MVGMIDPGAPEFVLSRAARRAGEERSLARRERAGDLVRLRPGVYVSAETWNGLGPDARFRALVFAAAEVVRPGTQFAGDAAAALLRLPSLGPWPSRVQALGGRAAGGRSSSGIERRSAPLDSNPLTMNGASITPLGRTVVDVSARSTFPRSVCMVDHAMRIPVDGEFRHGNKLASVTAEELLAVSASLAPFSGRTKAELAIRFGRGESGSIGESLSRAQMYLLGLPAPQLQVPFYDADGLIGYVDFYWPELDLIGEFDGRVKYNNRWYLRGQLPEEVVWAEKLREDRLRAVARDLVRWTWEIALSAPKLAARLAGHGLVAAR